MFAFCACGLAFAQKQMSQNQLAEKLEELKESGVYSEAQIDDIEQIISSANQNIINVVPGENAQADLDKVVEDALADIANVPSNSVVAGDIRPDGSSASGEGQADYGEGHDPDEIWGVVTNDSSIPGGIKLVIEKTDGSALSAIESASQSGGLVSAEGSSLSAEDMQRAVADKDIKTTLDVYLLMSDGSKVTEFEGMYKIKLLLPADMRGMSGLQVVYVADDGSEAKAENSVADLSEIVESAKTAAELQQGREEAKAEYDEIFEAVNGSAPTAEQVKEAYDAIDGAADKAGVESALEGALSDIYNDFMDGVGADDGVTVDEADRLMTDDEAKAVVEEGVRYADRTKTGIINVDTLGKLFADGEKVTLEEIKRRMPSYDKKVTFVKVLARGELGRVLVVEADDFSLEAVKMIALEGGRVIKTRRRQQ